MTTDEINSLLQVEYLDESPWLTVRISGELDVLTAASLQLPGPLLRWVTTVVFDVTDLKFCDSVGLEALDRQCEDLIHGGKEVRILGASGHLRRIARLSSLLGTVLP